MRRYMLALCACLLCASATITTATEPAKHPLWKAGLSSAVITPEEPLWMAGYAFRDHPATGREQDLRVKALALEDAVGTRGILITSDLIGFPKELSDRIRARIGRELGVGREHIILNSSHTHSGPVLEGSLPDIHDMGEARWRDVSVYTAWLEERVVATALNAVGALEPARLFAGSGIARFQVNRRNNTERELTALTELNGPNDYSVPVFRVAAPGGELRAILFGYACHPTVLNGYLWSGDYPGHAQAALEARYPGVCALFFQGAGADQNPLPRRSLPLAEQYGLTLAAAVGRVLDEPMRELSADLKAVYTEIDLPLATLPTERCLEEFVRTHSGYEQSWAKRMLRELRAGARFDATYPYPVQVWALGGLPLVSLGGEVVVGYARRIKAVLGDEAVVMGYSNDVMAYIPTERVLREGGYEGYNAYRAFGMPAPWAPGLEQKIYDGVFCLAEQVGLIGKPENNPINRTTMDHGKGFTARRYYSGFPEAHDTYNAISAASDGNIYYVLSSTGHDVAGRFYRYDPRTDRTEFIADLSEAVGEGGQNFIAQGKSHVEFYEHDGKLYFSTHIGYYQMIEGTERLPVEAPAGYSLYRGGYFLCYDMETGRCHPLALAPEGEGVLTMAMDKARGHLYGITWPTGYLIDYDLGTGRLHNAGPVDGAGESGVIGADYRVLCRSMFVDPRDGNLYYSTPEGNIYAYRPGWQTPRLVEGVDLRLDYFGKFDPSDAGSMGYNWRKIFWYEPEQVAYGVHGNSGYLFRYDPAAATVEIVERITSEPSRRSGMGDQFSYGYLGFMLGPDDTIYYLTGAPVYEDGKRVRGLDKIAMGAAKGIEHLHLVTYDLRRGRYRDLGPVFYEDGTFPTYVNSIAIDAAGDVYTLGRFMHEDKVVEDLVKIPVSGK